MDKYAFLMIRYKTPDIISDIQKRLKSEELYTENDIRFKYGIEYDSHITIAPCLDNDINIEKIKKYLLPIDKYQAYITNISSFDNENYDVLKCDIASMPIIKTNEKIRNHFTLNTEYKDYHPHMTIAYLKKGIIDKYKKNTMDKLIKLNPIEFWFSYYDKNGNEKTKTWR